MCARHPDCRHSCLVTSQTCSLHGMRSCRAACLHSPWGSSWRAAPWCAGWGRRWGGEHPSPRRRCSWQTQRSRRLRTASTSWRSLCRWIRWGTVPRGGRGGWRQRGCGCWLVSKQNVISKAKILTIRVLLWMCAFAFSKIAGLRKDLAIVPMNSDAADGCESRPPSADRSMGRIWLFRCCATDWILTKNHKETTSCSETAQYVKPTGERKMPLTYWKLE